MAAGPAEQQPGPTKITAPTMAMVVYWRFR
jgi:hypothetical protein